MKGWFIGLLGVLAARVLAAEAVTYTFGDEDKALAGRTYWSPVVTEDAPWQQWTTTRCLHRYYGVALGTKTDTRGEMGMLAVFEEPRPVQMVSVTCYASTKTAAELASQLTLTATFADQSTQTKTIDFTFSEPSTIEAAAPETLTFVFEGSAYLSSLVLANTTEGNAYLEVGEVVLYPTLPEVQVKLSVPSVCAVGARLSASASLKGGTGMYNRDYRFAWYLDERPASDEDLYVTERYAEPFFFIVPEEGTHQVNFLIVDVTGKETLTSKTFHATAQLAPSDVEVSNLTRTGFDVTWRCPSPVPPVSYTAEVKGDEKKETFAFSPTWIPDGEGNVVAALDFPIPLPAKREFLTATMIVAVAEFPTFEFSVDGASWKRVILGAGGVHFIAPAIDLNGVSSKLYLRALNCTSFEGDLSLTIYYRALKDPVVYEVPATGNIPTVSFRDLPTSEALKLVVVANYADGGTMLVTVEVQLALLDPFQAAMYLPSRSFFTLQWPEDADITSGEYKIFATVLAPRKGLFLSRLFHGTGDVAGKGIVLSNRTDETIDLASYTMLYTRASGSTAQWTMEGYTLPPQSEMLFVYPGAKIEMAMDAVEVKTTAMNFANGGTLALYKGTTLVNALTIQAGAVTRLEGSLEEEMMYPYKDDPTRSQLWAPWEADSTPETVVVEEVVVTRGGDYLQRSLSLQALQAAYPTATAFWLECVTTVGEAISSPCEASIWMLPVAKGFWLRLK